MVAGGIPTVQVLLDDGTSTFPYDITSKTRVGDTVSRGRGDELSTVTAGQLTLTVDNTDGRFTPGSTTIASPSPIKADVRIRVKVTPGGNLIGSADAGSFEGSVGGWAFNTLLGARTAGTSLAQSVVRATDGTNSLLATWSTSATGNFAGVAVATVIGQVYTFSVDLYVPTGSPNVRASAAFIANSAFVTTKDAWVRASVTFTATATTTIVGIDQTASTAGNTCFIASAMLNLGTTAQSFAAGGQTVNRFTGYVQSWPVAWPSGSDTLSEVTITATDAQARGERRTLRSVIEEEILADAPSALYTLGEPSTATTAADSSGNQNPAMVQVGAGTAVVFGGTPGPTTDGLTAATFAGGKWLSTGAPILLIGGVSPWGVSVAFSTTMSGTAAILAGDVGSVLIGIDSTGHLTSDAGAGVVSAGVVNDGQEHVAFAYATSATTFLYLDGVLVGSGLATTWAFLSGIMFGRSFTGSLAHIAQFNPPPSTTRIAVQATATLTGFAGESGTARITRTAGYANIPVGTLDTSLTNVPFVDITGASATSAIQQVGDAEMGLTFVDGSGNLTFHNRQRVPLKLATDVTVAANQLDPGTAFTTDMQGVINYYQVTATGTGNGAQTALDATSQTSHGRYPASATYLVSTDAEALDRGNWTIYTHKEPGPRVGTLVVDMLTLTAAQQATLLAVEPNTWVQVTGLPSQTPGGTTANLVVQGWSDSRSKDNWTLTLNVVDKATRYPNVWILDNATYSVLDSTTRVFV